MMGTGNGRNASFLMTFVIVADWTAVNLVLAHSWGRRLRPLSTGRPLRVRKPSSKENQT